MVKLVGQERPTNVPRRHTRCLSAGLRSSLHRLTDARCWSALIVMGLRFVALPAAVAAADTSISSALKQATGYETSQLQARPVCGAAAPGQIRCLAQMLTVKRSGRTASLLHAPHVRPASQKAAASTAPGQFTADYLQSAYDTTWLSANRGASDTVAIVDAYNDSSAYSDMEQFRTANGLLRSQPLCSSSDHNQLLRGRKPEWTDPRRCQTDTNDETGSWNVEESLDIDAVSTICPLCKIVMVEASSDDLRQRQPRAHRRRPRNRAFPLRPGSVPIRYRLSWGSLDTPPGASQLATSPRHTTRSPRPRFSGLGR